MDFRMNYLDGTPVPQRYLNQVERLVGQAAVAQEKIHPDELEEYAAGIAKRHDMLSGAEHPNPVGI